MTTDPVPPAGDDLDLPWHATGRLDPAETARLDALLARDPELARRAALARAERDETMALNEALGAPSLKARDALFARIAAEAPRAPAGPGWFARLAERVAGLAPRTLATAALAALALIVVQGALLTGAFRSGGDGARYATAFPPGAPGAGGTVLLVGFAPNATAAQITALLSGARASVVGGPNPGGLFEVRVADHALSPAETATVIEGLRASGSVALVLSESSGE